MSVSFGQAAMAVSTLRGFIGLNQLSVISDLCRGDEGSFFRSKLIELAATVSAMPETYAARGDDAKASLHYFAGGCDWWIIEKDRGAVDDEPGQFQSQAYGIADLGYGSELGYISLPEILAAGAELDLHFTPRPAAEILGGV